jgi:hypothetical protein
MNQLQVAMQSYNQMTRKQIGKTSARIGNFGPEAPGEDPAGLGIGQHWPRDWDFWP